MKKKWTYQKLKESADKYKYIRDWRKNEPSAHSTAIANRLLPELTKNMISLRGQPWTKERVQKVAARFEHKVDFLNCEPSAYQVAHRNKWIDEVCRHMKPLGNKEFRLVYCLKIKGTNKIYIGLTQNLKIRKQGHKKAIWHKNLKKEFGEDNFVYKKLTGYIPSLLAADKEKRFIQKFRNEGMEVLNTLKGGQLGTGKKFWTDKRIYEATKPFTYLKDFMKKEPAAYNAAMKSLKYYELTSHLKRLHSNNMWNIQNIKKSALKYIHRSIWKGQEAGAVQAARRLGILKQVTSHMKKKRPTQKWTEQKIKHIALLCKNKVEFKNKYPGADTAARKLGLYDRATLHMDNLKMKGPTHFNRKWTIEKIKESASAFKVLERWKESCRGAVSAAYKMGIIKEVTQHMVDGRYVYALSIKKEV